MKSPFDLHVLGTPPAFILSQDQTLMLKWCLCPASFIWHCLLLIRVASRSFDRSACSWISLKILEFSGLHYCLFVKDQCFFGCCCSQRQLWYLITSAFVCQQLFLKTFLSWKTYVFRGRFLYYHICQTSVNNFFEIFLNFFFVVVLSRYCPDNESEYITPYITCQHYFLNFLHKLSPAMQIPHVQGIFTTFLFYFTKKGSFCPSCSIRYAR